MKIEVLITPTPHTLSFQFVVWETHPHSTMCKVGLEFWQKGIFSPLTVLRPSIACSNRMGGGVSALISGHGEVRISHCIIFINNSHLLLLHLRIPPPPPSVPNRMNSVLTSTWPPKILAASPPPSNCQKLASYKCNGPNCCDRGWCTTQ